MFGPKYAGTHKVFGPMLRHNRSTAHRYDIQRGDSIVGLHCLYDYEVSAFGNTA